MKRILIVQPYVPEYRREFFSLLFQSALKNGIELVVFAPKPEQRFTLRNDSITDLPFMREIGIFRFKLLKRQIDIYRYPSNIKVSDFDLVVLEQTLKNLQYPLNLLRRLSKTKIALWGHGRTIVKEKSRFETWLQLVLSKRADFIFSYTKNGRDYLVNSGYPERKVISLRNTNSSESRLVRIMNLEKSSDRARGEKETHCCFIGAIETTKGLEMLFEAIPIIKAKIPSFKFTFIGDGPESIRVSELSSNTDYVDWLGYKSQDEIDQIAHQFSLILNPGRVGLIAVDSLMLLLPIVTMTDTLHAPEYEYVSGNAASVSVGGNAENYAQTVIELLSNPAKIQKMRDVCALERKRYTFENMVQCFTDGILTVLTEGDGNL